MKPMTAREVNTYKICDRAAEVILLLILVALVVYFTPSCTGELPQTVIEAFITE